MFELTKHIESLLLKNDCVIVPHLGGFVTHYMPARWVKEENLFLPPYRSVAFNAQLTVNDGLLVQSYMQANDSSYPDTLKWVERDVQEVKERLQQDGEFVFEGIGRLLLRLDGRYDFIPLESGVLSPELYGLDAFHAERLSAGKQTSSLAQTLKGKGLRVLKAARKKRTTTSVPIGRALARTAVAAVATLLLYFAWSTPISQLSGASENWAAVGDHSIFGPAETPRPHQAVDRKPLPVVSAPQPSAPGSETPAVAAPENRPATTVPAEEAGRYSLVLASAIPLANAEAYAEQLKSAGHDDVFVYRKRRMVRVLCGHFADEATAYAHLRKLRDDAEFADAWVIELK